MYKYDAFISYRHIAPDQEVAGQIHKLLETFKIPRKAQIASGKKKFSRVFRDREELPLIANLAEGIEQALIDSEWLIVVCTPELLQSKWCLKEIDTFLDLGRRKKILTVLVSGTPETSFPKQIRFDYDDNGKEVEPLAANIVANTSEEREKLLKEEILRLIAPMLGVNYDELKQRHRERRIRLLAKIAVASAVFFAVFGGFSAFQAVQRNQQRGIAVEQRGIAVEQKGIAEEQRTIAVKNQVGLLLERSKTLADGGNKLIGLNFALQAADANDILGGERAQIARALEYAAYLRSFEPICEIKLGNIHLEKLIFSPDDRFVLGVSNKNAATLIDGVTGETIYSVSDTWQPIEAVTFSKNGEYFLTLSAWASSMSVYLTETGEKITNYRTNSGSAFDIMSAHFSNEDGFAILEMVDKIVLVDFINEKSLDLFSGKMTAFRTQYVPGILSPKSDVFAMATSSGELLIGDLEGDNFKALKLVDYNTMVTPRAFSPDGSLLAISSAFNTVVLKTGDFSQVFEVSGSFNDSAESLAFSKNGTLLAAASTTGVSVYSLATGKPVYTISNGDNNTVCYVRASNDGGYLLVLTSNARVFEFASGKEISDCDGVRILDGIFANTSNRLLLSHYTGQSFVLGSPEDATYNLPVTAEMREKVARFTPPKRQAMLQSQYNFYDNGFYYEKNDFLYIDPTGRYCAKPYPDGYVEIWDLDAGDTPKYALAESFKVVRDIVFSGDLMVAGDADGRIILFDLQNGTVKSVLFTDLTGITQIEPSPDGNYFIARTFIGEKALVFNRDGEGLFNISGDKITQVGFSENGEWAIAKCADGSQIGGTMLGDFDALKSRAEKITGR